MNDKTLVVSEIFPPKVGGSGRWLWEIYRRLPCEQFVLAVGDHAEAEAFDRTHDVRLLRMPLTFTTWGISQPRGMREYWQVFRRLQAVVRDQRIDMLHCARCMPEGLLALALCYRHRIPYACYVHGEELGVAQLCREFQILTRRVLRSAEFIVVNSRNSERLVTEEWHIPAQRVRLMHPGVDTNRFTPAERCAGTRRELGWGDRPVVLTVSRLQKRKGHDQMIAAIEVIRRAVPDVLYAIAGGGEEHATLVALVERLNLREHVQFMGEVDEINLVRCYQQCDLFVLPNRQIGGDFEGFGMVLLEAQACGKPVIAGASGGTAETMRIPQTGRVLNCEGPSELAATVIELLADEAARAGMAVAARKWVVDHFDWAALSRQAEQLFRRPGVGGVTSTALVPA